MEHRGTVGSGNARQSHQRAGQRFHGVSGLPRQRPQERVVPSLESGELLEAEPAREQFHRLGASLGDEVWLAGKTARVFDKEDAAPPRYLDPPELS